MGPIFNQQPAHLRLWYRATGGSMERYLESQATKKSCKGIHQEKTIALAEPQETRIILKICQFYKGKMKGSCFWNQKGSTIDGWLLPSIFFRPSTTCRMKKSDKNISAAAVREVHSTSKDKRRSVLFRKKLPISHASRSWSNKDIAMWLLSKPAPQPSHPLQGEYPPRPFTTRWALSSKDNGGKALRNWMSKFS